MQMPTQNTSNPATVEKPIKSTARGYKYKPPIEYASTIVDVNKPT